MFGFLKPKREIVPKNKIIIGDKWTSFQGTHNNKSLIGRINTELRNLAGHPEYAYRVGIAIPLKNPDKNGLPNPEENNALYLIEDQIFERLQRNNESIVGIIITTSGMREFIIYTSNPKGIEMKINEIKINNKNYEIQSYIERDEKWDTYQQFLLKS